MTEPLAGRPPAGHAVDPRNENDESRSRAEGDGASAPEPPSAPCPTCGSALPLGPLCGRCQANDAILEFLAKPVVCSFRTSTSPAVGDPRELDTQAAPCRKGDSIIGPWWHCTLPADHVGACAPRTPPPHPDACPRCGAYPGVPCLRLADDHPKPGEVLVHHERRSRA